MAGSLLGVLGKTVRADGGKHAKRLVVFFSPDGTIHSHWRPSGSDSNFSFPAGSILEPLAAHQSDIIVCDGINFKDVSNHEAGMVNMLTGGGTASSASGGMSLDQYVASKIGKGDKFQSLDLGVLTSPWGSTTQTRMAYSAPGVRVEPDDDPRHVYKRMFGDVMGGSGGPPVDDALAGRKSVLDLVQGEITDLRGRVGAEEKAKLDQHLDSIRKVELGLGGGMTTGSCAAPAAPGAFNPQSYPDFPSLGKGHMDMLVLALACGMTKVASIQWSHTVSEVPFSWVGAAEHHGLSHSDDGNTAGVADFVKTERWFAQQFAYLLDQLKKTPDPLGGSLLDNTQVVWCKELGDSRMHDCISVPFVLAGGGYFKPGRYLNFNGAPHQKLLVSICQALGLDNQTFGDETKGSGPLAGLT